MLFPIKKYAQAVAQGNAVTQDTLHLLFPNLNQLLNFQRKFLIRVEGTAEMPWHDQRWGSLFSNNVSAGFHFPLVLSPVSPLSPLRPVELFR